MSWRRSSSSKIIADEIVRICQTGEFEEFKQRTETYTIEAESINKLSLLNVVCQRQRVDQRFVEELLKRDADVNNKYGPDNQTPLHSVCARGNKEIIQLLLNAKADTNAVDKNNNTPLHIATENCRVFAAGLLLQHSANPTIPNNDKYTPPQLAVTCKVPTAMLHMGCSQQFIRFVYLMLAECEYVDTIVIDSVDNNGNTPLLVCVKNSLEAADSKSGPNWSDAVRLLLSFNINIRAANKKTETIISLLQHDNDKKDVLKTVLTHFICKEKKYKLDLSGLHLDRVSPMLISILPELNIRVLDLINNRLETLPVEILNVGLDKVKLKGNPLTKIPAAYRSGNWQKVEKYLNTLKNRSSSWKERRILFVGEEGTGKSTLLKTISRKKNRVSCKKNLATDGIQIHTNLPLQTSILHECEFNISGWDLGGQEVLYPTHQFFLASSCTYFIIFNFLRVDSSRIEYWMRQIKVLSKASFEQDLSIYIIGTHIDDENCTQSLIDETIEALQQKYRKQIFPGLKGIFAVSCKTGQGISQLKENLLQHYSNHQITIPITWIRLYDYIKDRKSTVQWVTWAIFSKWAKDCDIVADELTSAINFLANYGMINHLQLPGGDRNEDMIVLDPQWLSDIMSCIISIRTSNWVRDGIIQSDKIPLIFSKYPPSIHENLVKIMCKFEILYKMKGKSENFVIPSLLPEICEQEQFSTFWPMEMNKERGYIEIGRVIKFPFLPIGFFGRLIVHLLHLSRIKSKFIWRYGIVAALKSQILRKRKKQCVGKVVFDEATCEVEVRVRYPASISYNAFTGERVQGHSYAGLLLRTLLEAVSTMVEGHNMECNIKRFITCSHCLKNGNYQNPYLFKYSDIISAIKARNAFVFCQGIQSPTRCINISQLAPDISFSDVKEIHASELTFGELLGQGGFGKVYKGTYKISSSESPIDIAIKELLHDKNTNETDNEHKYAEFQQEIFIMTQISHKNLVKLFGITKTPLRMILEFVPLGDLMNFIHPKLDTFNENGEVDRTTVTKEQFPWKLRLLIALDIAKGMKYLQQITPPIVHRDLRSPNIFLQSLSEDENQIRAKVADFGLSRSTGAEIKGALPTWAWLAPEVITGNSSYNELSDNYSYGIVCWEIASRKLPFEEYRDGTHLSSNGEALTDTNIQNLIITKSLRPSMPPESEEVPEEFKEIIQSSWSKTPESRMSFSEIVNRLSKLLNIEQTDEDEKVDTTVIHNEPHCLSKVNQPPTRALTDSKLSRTMSENAVHSSLAKIRSATFNFDVSNKSLEDENNQNFNILYSTNDNQKIIPPQGKKFSSFVLADDIYWFGFMDGHFGSLEKLKDPPIKYIKGHPTTIASILNVAASNQVWSASTDGTIIVWKYFPLLCTPQLQSEFSTNPNENECLFQFKEFFLIRYENGRQSIWIVLNNHVHNVSNIAIYNSSCILFRTITINDIVSYVCLFKQNIWIAANSKIYLYTLEGDTMLLHWPAHPDKHSITCLLPVQKSLQVWSADDKGSIVVWEYNNQQIIKVNTLTAHGSSPITCVIELHDNLVASASRNNIIIWDIYKLVPVQEISTTCPIINLFASDKRLISLDESTIQFWEYKFSHGSPVARFRKALPKERGMRTTQLCKDRRAITASDPSLVQLKRT